MQMTAVIFDLDGTLLDTLEDIAVSANSVLRSLDYEGHSVAAFRSFIGSGVDVLFERALPAAAAADRRLIDLAVERFRVVYADGWHINSRPYAGIAALELEHRRYARCGGGASVGDDNARSGWQTFLCR